MIVLVAAATDRRGERRDDRRRDDRRSDRPRGDRKPRHQGEGFKPYFKRLIECGLFRAIHIFYYLIVNTIYLDK